MSGTYPWLKLWNEAPTDPKWLAVADMAGSSPAVAWHSFSIGMAYANERPGEARGSITGLNPQVIASFCRVAVDEIRRVLQAFREMGLLLGDRFKAWAKRQGKGEQEKSPGAIRTSRYRRRKAEAEAEPELPLVTVLAEASPEASQTGAEEEGVAQRIPDDLKNEGESFGRDAPFEKAEPSTVDNVVVLKNAAGPVLKAQKKEMRRQKVIRFIIARYSGEEQERRMNGMLGLDSIRDAQWWFDKCDAERQVVDWDDVRDAQPAHSLTHLGALVG